MEANGSHFFRQGSEDSYNRRANDSSLLNNMMSENQRAAKQPPRGANRYSDYNHDSEASQYTRVNRQYSESGRGRVPTQYSDSDGSSSSRFSGFDDANNITVTSNLSADAQEFYPRNYKESKDDENPQEERDMLEHLMSMIKQLALVPGEFDSLFGSFVDIFATCIHNDAQLKFAVDIIFTQALELQNFRYSGARLFNCLNNLFKPEKTHLRELLFARCNEELDRMPEYANDNPKKLYELGLFMTELFVQLENSQGSGERVVEIGKGVWDVIRKLILCRTTDSIKCIFQMLKLGGPALASWDPQTMQSIISMIASLPNSGRLEKSARNIISCIIEQHENNWQNRLENAPTRRLSQPPPPPPPIVERTPSVDETDPVFYGPDGIVLSPEENLFLQEMLENEENFEETEEPGMDPEHEEAFEEFLRELESQKIK